MSRQNFIWVNILITLFLLFLVMACTGIRSSRHNTKLPPEQEWLIAELQDIYYLDRVHRIKLDKPPGFSKVQKDSLWQVIKQTDEQNQIRIDSIIAQYGYPGKSLVGDTLQKVGWLVIHHSNADYMRKYQGLLMEQARLRELNPNLVMATIDRLHWIETDMVIFSNQSFQTRNTTVNVDSLRALMGLTN
ncbi:MAG TPA: hypothetical protein DCR93_13885 [Cytophagales bacterium]|nr:hypothetical protein [Cytophagales bacterium]HAP60530.1 hypothetical protein [Cytophagales bacterium]